MIEITEIEKDLIEKGNPTSFYRVTFRADGNRMYRDMRLNNELPDDILKQELARFAKRYLTKLDYRKAEKMGQQIIKQPNGKYALFSSIVNDFIMIEADPQDIIDEWVRQYKLDMEKSVAEIVTALKKNEKPYGEFTMPFDEAVKTVKQCHGENAESLRKLVDRRV